MALASFSGPGLSWKRTGLDSASVKRQRFIVWSRSCQHLLAIAFSEGVRK